MMGPQPKGLTIVTHSMPTPSDMILAGEEHEVEDEGCEIVA